MGKKKGWTDNSSIGGELEEYQSDEDKLWNYLSGIPIPDLITQDRIKQVAEYVPRLEKIIDDEDCQISVRSDKLCISIMITSKYDFGFVFDGIKDIIDDAFGLDVVTLADGRVRLIIGFE